MKIAISTICSIDYGAYFHSIALYKLLEKMNYKVELLNDIMLVKYNNGFLLALIGDKVLPNFVKKIVRKKVMRYDAFCILKDDLKKYISKPFFDISKIEKNYDCILVGSDELWSSSKEIQNKIVKEYFCVGVNIPHISYSTSGIHIDKFTNKKIDVVNNLNTFKAIAVRDQYTKEWVDEYTGRDVPVVMDPALLNPFYVEEIKNSGKNYEVKDKFIAVYGEHFSDDQIKSIINFANKEHYKLKALAWRHKWCDEFAIVNSAIELQEEFYKSSYCCVSTLHGTIFCIAHNKQFVSFNDNKLRGVKVIDILSRLKLEDRIYNGNDDIFYMKIDYEKTNKIVDEFRQFSLNYLKSALKEVEMEINKK